MDNYSLWEAKEAREDAWLRKQPICCHCHHHIQDEKMFVINDDFYHDECAREEFEKFTEDVVA